MYSIALTMDLEGSAAMNALRMKRFKSESDFGPPFELWWTMNHSANLLAAADEELSSNPHLTQEQVDEIVADRMAHTEVKVEIAPSSVMVDRSVSLSCHSPSAVVNMGCISNRAVVRN